MGYIICIGERHWIKRTARFGAIHGEIYLTDDRTDAFIFTRKTDADKRADILAYRVESYALDKHKFDVRGLSIDDIRVVDVIETAQ